MELLSVSELRTGMVLAMEVVTENFVAIAAEATVLTDDIIAKFVKLNIDFVYVNSEENLVESEEPMIFDNLDSIEALNYNYSRTIKMLSNIFQNARIGEAKVDSDVFSAIEPLIEGILIHDNVLSKLRVIEYNDDYTLKHSVNVGLLSAMIGKWLRFSNIEIKEIALAGMLHDVGKTKIPQYIINKPGDLSSDEFDIAKKHSTYSYDILSEQIKFNAKIKNGVLYHHERYDGSGYPEGLTGADIPQYSRIIAIADVFDAMTADKVYRKRISPFVAAEAIKLMSFDKLDPTITNLFLKKLSQFYVGNKVMLSTGEIGEVVYLNKFNLTKPLVKVNEKYVDLSTTMDIIIKDVI